jgi:hypothetical protein
MRNLFTLPLLLAMVLTGSLKAQTTFSHSHLPAAPLAASVRPADLTTRYSPTLQNLEMPVPGSGSERGQILAYKEARARNFSPQADAEGVVMLRSTGGVASPPTVGNNFIGNSYNLRVPCDNDMAISDSGRIVSVINSTVWMMDMSGVMHDFFSLDDFFAPLGLATSDAFDPKVLYDPEQDRFILVALNGFTPTTSDIVVAFSQTNDPVGPWNLYSLPGNPLSDTSWTDYPIISMSEKEVFITVNLLWPDSSWQTGFKQSIIWQLDKQDGYNGDSLDKDMWYDVKYGGKAIRNLCPIRGGGSSKGPNMYFLSNRNFATTGDTIFIVETADTIGAPSPLLTVDMRQTDVPYAVPPNARQKFSLYLQTNDARVLNGFMEDNQIQFVGNTLNPATGYCAIYHGTVSDVSGAKTVTGQIIGDSLLDLGYANLSWSGLVSGDHDAIITFDHTSADTFAGISCVYSDGLGNYSPRTLIRKGSSILNILPGTLERWGDYSGSQRRYSKPGTVWMAGMYGKTSTTQGTWLAELYPPTVVSALPAATPESPVMAWPNPVEERIFLEFTLSAPQTTSISLVDLQGRVVKQFFNDLAKKGLNQFSFDTQDLPSGIYFLNVTSHGKVIATQKIVKP